MRNSTYDWIIGPSRWLKPHPERRERDNKDSNIKYNWIVDPIGLVEPFTRRERYKWVSGGLKCTRTTFHLGLVKPNANFLKKSRLNRLRCTALGLSLLSTMLWKAILLVTYVPRLFAQYICDVIERRLRRNYRGIRFIHKLDFLGDFRDDFVEECAARPLFRVTSTFHMSKTCPGLEELLPEYAAKALYSSIHGMIKSTPLVTKHFNPLAIEPVSNLRHTVEFYTRAAIRIIIWRWKKGSHWWGAEQAWEKMHDRMPFSLSTYFHLLGCGYEYFRPTLALMGPLAIKAVKACWGLFLKRYLNIVLKNRTIWHRWQHYRIVYQDEYVHNYTAWVAEKDPYRLDRFHGFIKRMMDYDVFGKSPEAQRRRNFQRWWFGLSLPQRLMTTRMSRVEWLVNQVPMIWQARLTFRTVRELEIIVRALNHFLVVRLIWMIRSASFHTVAQLNREIFQYSNYGSDN